MYVIFIGNCIRVVDCSMEVPQSFAIILDIQVAGTCLHAVASHVFGTL